MLNDLKIANETTMSVKLEACEECSLICHAMHRRNGDASAIATSFFKVMFGFNYNDLLLLPPNFARRVQHLIDQQAQLEDSSGEQWTVTVSKVEDSLAFKEGWNAFSTDHGLKVGEILVFHHITLSNPAHFFVQIYGASGCPVFRSVKDNGTSNKRSRTDGEFGTKDGPSRVNDNELGSNPSVDFDGTDVQRLQVVPKTRQYEEPMCMIERDDGYIQEEYRSHLFDLSECEVPVRAEKLSHRGSTILELDLLKDNSVNPSQDLMETCIEKPAENGKKSVAKPKEEAVGKKPEKPNATHPTETMKVTNTEPAEMSDKHAWKGMLRGTKEKGIKEGSHTAFSLPTEVKYVKAKDEPIDFDDIDTPLSDNAGASCLVVIGSESYLELPTEFPSIISAKSRADSRIVLIRGPDTRLWAVMYTQKFGIKSLNSGWKAFSKENGVQPGDECLFRYEYSDQDCIFRFNIVNRQS